MKLSKQTSDAVEILVFCLRPDDELLKVGRIAEELGLTKQMALKLAHVLNQAGFLEAVRGPKGGIRLTDAARSAKLGEIVRALELLPTERGKSDSGSLFGGYIDEAFEAFLSVLDQHTLADLARRPRRATKRKPSRQAGRKATKAARIAGASSQKRASKSAGRDIAL
jgi:Rrf2 family protein